MRKISRLYNNWINFLKANPDTKYFSSEKPFENFIRTLYNDELESWTSFELIEYFAYKWNDSEVDKTKLLNQDDRFLSELKRFLEINKHKHYIVVPIFISICSADIKLKHLRIITGSEEEKIGKLTKMSGISKRLGVSFSEHTKSSRSPSFFVYPLMIIPIKSHTDSVRLRSVDLAKLYFYILRTFWMAEIKKPIPHDEDRFKARYRTGTAFHENSHLAIWSKRYANFSHSPLWYNISFNTDLAYINTNGKQIDKMVEILILKNEKSSWNRKFLNALIMLNKGLDLEIDHEESLSLLLYFSTAESLLCEGRNEKSLRLAAILPKQSKIKNIDMPYCSSTIKELYLLRNDFVHSATNVNVSNIQLKKDVNPLVLMTSLVANLIINNYDKGNTKDIALWNQECDQCFERKVFG